MKESAYINGCIFIESLEDDKSTKKIFDTVERECKIHNWLAKYHSISTGHELIEIIKAIAANGEIFPVIHLSAHGNQTEIILKKDRVTYVELVDHLIKLNIQTKNSLIMVMALCSGVFQAKAFETAALPPFFAVYGPPKKINWDFLDNYLLDFYEVFLKSKSIGEGLDFCDDKYGSGKLVWYSCVRFYMKSMHQLKARFNSGQMKHDFFESYKRQTGDKIPYDLKEKTQYKEGQKGYLEEAMKIYKRHYFMIDKFPENEERFKEIPETID